jgi:hypothetical protein
MDRFMNRVYGIGLSAPNATFLALAALLAPTVVRLALG